MLHWRPGHFVVEDAPRDSRRAAGAGASVVRARETPGGGAGAAVGPAAAAAAVVVVVAAVVVVVVLAVLAVEVAVRVALVTLAAMFRAPHCLVNAVRCGSLRCSLDAERDADQEHADGSGHASSCCQQRLWQGEPTADSQGGFRTGSWMTGTL